MIRRTTALIQWLIDSGIACLALSIVGSMAAALLVLICLAGFESHLPRGAGFALFGFAAFLQFCSFINGLALLLETPMFNRPKVVLNRITMAFCICVATMISFFFFLCFAVRF